MFKEDMMALRDAFKILCWRNRNSAVHLIRSNQWFVWLQVFHTRQFKGIPSSCQMSRIQSGFGAKTDAEILDSQKEIVDQAARNRKKDRENPDVFGLVAYSEQPYDLKKFNQKKSGLKAKNISDIRQRSEGSWSSVFGTLTEEHEDSEDERFQDDDKEVDEFEKPYVRLDSTGRKHYPDWYGRRIAKFGRAGKVYEAIQVLDEEMLKQDRVRPNQYVFTVLIGVLGRHGYTKKAFKIFNQMKKFGLAPQDPTYTALFNACSNSPWPEDGLRRANDLRQVMVEKDHQPNLMTFNAMIKAYAKCGDLRTAFSVVEEAIASGHKPDGYCYSSLLIACASDRQAGFKHAIEVWRMMRKRKVVSPQTFHYNLLLRIVRDCSLGDEVYMQQLIHRREVSPVVGERPDPGTRSMQSNQRSCADLGHQGIQKFQSIAVDSVPKEQTDFTLQKFESTPGLLLAAEPCITNGASVFDMEVPNLLNPRAQFRDLISLEMPKSSAERLALLGGLPGILGHMAKDGAQPDLKTFTILLETVSSAPQMESDLLATMTLNNVKPDVDFFSLLIRKRNLRKDYFGAKDVLRLMEKIGLKPNIRTFGCLAMGCSHKENAIQLFTEIEKAGLVPNTEIFDILVYQSNWDFNYKLHLLVAMKSYNVLPNENLIKKLESKIRLARTLIVQKERGESVPDFCREERFGKNFQKFVSFYKTWLLSTNLELDVHPWATFVQPTPVIQEDDHKDTAQTTKKRQR